MRTWRITFTCPPGVDRATAQMLIAGQLYEAELYQVTPHAGLELYNLVYPAAPEPSDKFAVVVAAAMSEAVRVTVIEFAPGVWRSIMPVEAVGAAEQTEAPQRENPRRRFPPRQV